MDTLLKDLPEHKERIEDYQVLRQINDVLEEMSDWSESRQEYIISASMFGYAVDKIGKNIADFVNENYEWKGIKA